MPQSLSRLGVHLVFSTRNRDRGLTSEVRAELFPYVATCLRSWDCLPIELGGVEDHVHLLFLSARTLSAADLTERVKTGTSKWIKSRWPAKRDFSWQRGYAAFAVGGRDEALVADYIKAQEEHHRKLTFEEEYRGFLTEHKIPFDERYFLD